MTQFVSLSQSAQTIINGYITAAKWKYVFDDGAAKRLVVSLYALRPDASQEVLQELHAFVTDLSEQLSKEEIDTLLAEYPQVVMYCHSCEKPYYDTTGIPQEGFSPKDSDFRTPKDFVELMLTMASCKRDSDIFLPFSGLGSFALYQKEPCHYDMAELSRSAWAYSKILISSQGIQANIECRDCLVQQPNRTGCVNQKRYDYIISFPPMGIKGNRGEANLADTMMYYAQNALKDNGEMLCLLPLSVTFSSPWLCFRKSLMWDSHKEFSAFVISLPNLLDPYTRVPMCLLCMVKDYKGRVALMDATDKAFVSLSDEAGCKRKRATLEVDTIIQKLSNGDEQFVWKGQTSDLTGDVYLKPSRYLIPQVIPALQKGEEPVRLEDVIKIEPLQPYRKGGNKELPFIGMKELSSSYLNCDINISDLAPRSNVSGRVLTSDCLLLGFIGGKFKVGRLHGISPDSPVILHPEIIPFEFSSDWVVEEFLLRSLMSENAELQGRMMSTGTIISRLSQKDLLSIVINVPIQKERQEALLKEDTRKSLTDADRKIIESHENFRKDIHMKKHAIGQTLFNLSNWWNALQQARKEGNGIVADNATVGKIRKVSVSSIYDNLQNAIKQLQQQINKFDRGNGLVVKKFALTEFIENYIERKGNTLFQYQYDSTLHHASRTIPEMDIDDATGEASETGKILLNEGDPIEYVEFSPEALEMVFDNIVSNACCHGFNNSPDQHNIISIELKTEGDEYVVVISNNGAAVHAQLNPSEVFIYGKSSKLGKGSDNGEFHSGIGGYEIQQLMQEFGGDAEFISTPESEFKVSYKLIFHNTNI